MTFFSNLIEDLLRDNYDFEKSIVLVSSQHEAARFRKVYAHYKKNAALPKILNVRQFSEQKIETFLKFLDLTENEALALAAFRAYRQNAEHFPPYDFKFSEPTCGEKIHQALSGKVIFATLPDNTIFLEKTYQMISENGYFPKLSSYTKERWKTPRRAHVFKTHDDEATFIAASCYHAKQRPYILCKDPALKQKIEMRLLSYGLIPSTYLQQPCAETPVGSFLLALGFYVSNPSKKAGQALLMHPLISKLKRTKLLTPTFLKNGLKTFREFLDVAMTFLGALPKCLNIEQSSILQTLRKVHRVFSFSLLKKIIMLEQPTMLCGKSDVVMLSEKEILAVENTPLIIAGFTNEHWNNEKKTAHPWAPPQHEDLTDSFYLNLALASPQVIFTRALSSGLTALTPSSLWHHLVLNVQKEEGPQKMHCHQLRFSPPRPPISLRPTTLSVTDVTMLLRNPYGFYAKKILRLHPIDHTESTRRERGIFIHALLAELFTKKKNAAIFA